MISNGKHEIQIDIEKITGFAGAIFNGYENKETGKKPGKDPLHKLFESETGEMFEGTENFTWISEE